MCGIYRDLLKGMGIKESVCHNKSHILLQDRNHRRIANMKALYLALMQLQLNNTVLEMVKFENLTVKEQMIKVSFVNSLTYFVSLYLTYFELLLVVT